MMGSEGERSKESEVLSGREKYEIHFVRLKDKLTTVRGIG